MSLLHPAFVYGFGLVILPVLLHFLLRQKPKIVARHKVGLGGLPVCLKRNAGEDIFGYVEKTLKPALLDRCAEALPGDLRDCDASGAGSGPGAGRSGSAP